MENQSENKVKSKKPYLFLAGLILGYSGLACLVGDIWFLSINIIYDGGSTFWPTQFTMIGILCYVISLFCFAKNIHIPRFEKRCLEGILFIVFSGLILVAGNFLYSIHIRNHINHEKVEYTSLIVRNLAYEVEQIQSEMGRIPMNKEELVSLRNKPMPKTPWNHNVYYLVAKDKPDAYIIKALSFPSFGRVLLHTYDSEKPKQGVVVEDEYDD